MLTKLERVSSTIKYSNPYWQYGFDVYTKPDGSHGEYHYVHSSGSVMVIPEFADGTFLLTKQYRYLNQRESLEFPGGGIPKGISAAEQAQKELQEESGWKAGSIIVLGIFNPCNGLLDEICSVFLARDLTPASPSIRHDDSEEFERLRVSKREFSALVRSGELWDGMTLAAWQMFLAHNSADE